MFGFYMEFDYVWMVIDRGIVCYCLSDVSVFFVGCVVGLLIDKFF